jgi:toxin FitB
MLVDSNILIYAAQPAHAYLRRFIADHAPAVSAVSYVEVLGYHQLDDQEQQYLEEFFRLARVLPLSQAVLDQAVALRQQRRNVPRRCSGGRHGAGAWTNAGDPQCG